jgi:glyoxylase-like metal-dependent hydrolase (beta-lactamase superfamily II)
VYLPQPENDYWCDNEVMLQMPENRRDGFKKAQSIIAAYKDRLHLFQPDEIESNSCNLLAGITGIAIYGHTPGHTGYMLESEGQKLFVWGDLTHAMAVQMPHPEISVTYDVNPTQAAGSRAKVLEYVSKNRIPIAGMHIAFPGMGNIEKSGAKYIFKAFE